MNSQSIIEIILIGILLLCGYLFLLRYIKNSLSSRTSTTTLAIVVLVFYGIISGVLLFILYTMGDLDYVFLCVLALSSVTTVIAMVGYLMRNYSEINKGALALFIVYLMALSYITIFSRNNNAHDTSVLVSFSSIEEAMETGSAAPLRHMLLNVAMFVPVGFLLVMTRPARLNKLFIVGPLSLLLSVMIESIQLVTRLGQCDIEDIVANTLGGVVGLMVYRVYARLFHRYEEDEDEDEAEE